MALGVQSDMEFISLVFQTYSIYPLGLKFRSPYAAQRNAGLLIFSFSCNEFVNNPAFRFTPYGLPIDWRNSIADILMKAGMRPIQCALNKPMFDWIVVNVINMVT